MHTCASPLSPPTHPCHTTHNQHTTHLSHPRPMDSVPVQRPSKKASRLDLQRARLACTCVHNFGGRGCCKTHRAHTCAAQQISIAQHTRLHGARAYIFTHARVHAHERLPWALGNIGPLGDRTPVKNSIDISWWGVGRLRSNLGNVGFWYFGDGM